MISGLRLIIQCVWDSVEGTDEMRLVICEFLKLGDMYMEVHYMILSNLLYVRKFS